MRGRKPIPTKLKVLQGAQPCRINRAEPKLPTNSTPKPPEWLGIYGKNRWRKLAPMLSTVGLLTDGDIPAFEQLCDEYQSIRTDPTNGSARDRYRKLLTEFGLTPSSRSRIKAAAEAPKDNLAIFLEETKAAK